MTKNLSARRGPRRSLPTTKRVTETDRVEHSLLGKRHRPEAATPLAPDRFPIAHGGVLKQLVVPHSAKLKEQSRDWLSWDLTSRQLCDLELLINGAFSPLDGFMTRADYERVCSEMRLADGNLWPIPVVLDVSEAFAERLRAGAKLALRDAEGVMLAVLTVEDIWRPNRLME